MDYIYQEMLDTISQVNVEEHLQIYSDTFGIDMDYAWPKFEVGISKYVTGLKTYHLHTSEIIRISNFAVL